MDNTTSTALTPYREKKNVRPGLMVTGLVFLILGFSLLHKIADFDIWYHLSIGREIAGLGHLPATEFLVYPNAGQPGEFHEWGFGLLMYLAHEVGGYRGMSVLNALVCTLAFWFLFSALGRQPMRMFVGLVLLIPVYFWMEVRLVYRVETFLYLALACEIWLLEGFLREGDWRLLVPIPALGLVLSQLHPSVIMLVLVLGAYGLQVLWQRRAQRAGQTRYAAQFALCGIATMLFAMVNPYGWHQVVLPFILAGASRVTTIINEFQPSLGSPFQWVYVSLLALSALAIAVNRRRRLVDVLLLLGFGYLAFRFLRNIGMFALVMYVPITHGLTDLIGRLTALRSPRGSNSRIGRPAWVGRTAILLIFGLFAVNRLTHDGWGAGVAEGMFPESAAQTILEVHPPGRIFNYYDMGGYLGWALGGVYQVSIDGRQFRSNRALATHNAVVTARPGWQTALDRFEVNTIVTRGTRTYEAELIPLVKILAGDPGWLLAGRWGRSLLFFRRGAVTEVSTGPPLDKREVWEQVRDEAEAYIKYLPDRAPAYYSLGEAMLGLGEPDSAIAAFRHYQSLRPDDRAAAQRLAELEAKHYDIHN